MRASVRHFELPAHDVERAAAFYRRVFDWRVELLVWDGPAYFTIRWDDGPQGGRPRDDRPRDDAGSPVGERGGGGGLMEANALGSPHPLLVVHLWDGSMEDCLQRIREAGGEVVESAQAVGEMGHFARFRDPEGNLLGLWQDGPG